MTNLSCTCATRAVSEKVKDLFRASRKVHQNGAVARMNANPTKTRSRALLFFNPVRAFASKNINKPVALKLSNSMYASFTVPLLISIQLATKSPSIQKTAGRRERESAIRIQQRRIKGE